MIEFQEAYDIVTSTEMRTGTEMIPWTSSLNRILASDVVSDMDLPPFDKAAVDGFACRKEDLDNELEILETIPAGIWPSRKIGRNQCSRIMTGAPVPEGADCVLMVEDTIITPSGKVRLTIPFRKENMAFRGEDAGKGDVLLGSGRLISPQDIAVMASAGQVNVVVSKKVRIGVASSGSELVEPEKVPAPSQIRNSNSSQLMAQIERTGAEGKYYGIAPDDEEQTFEIVERAIAENDIMIITGGVSMGDFDFVPSVLDRAGVKILFSRVAVQPGKPTTFGLHPDTAVFGLPGNPVSSFLQFELLVRPLVYKMMGHDWKPLEFSMPMRERFERKFADRLAFIPVRITGGGAVIPVEYHGSAHISALPGADGIIAMPVGKNILERGEIVSVRPI
ncbi:MAG TPA: molybdopterin molybdotransferase MoeA [Bacteroidales bacterium]|nr:molybdopterin molybdotransferase MoeA [Bacteroidales bacterium]